MSYEKATILSTLSKIQNGELVLPAIQRDFVWEPDRMYKLLDTIFRGYPFSTLLFWNTKQRVQYREFTKDWSDDYHFTFQVKPDGKKGTMVLDGQQRLQTIYLAIYGSYDHRVLYFDLLSGIEPDDISQAKYHFEYLSSKEAEDLNNQQAGIQHWVPLRDLANLGSKQLTARTIQYLTALNIPSESESGQRLSQNMSAAFNALRVEEALNYFTVDKEYGEDGLVTNLDEILEIFVRVNSGGEVLSKSDLMFSLMQMLWESASDTITDLTDQLNAQERYDFDKDFILKVALVCTNHGARYEVDKLRKETNVQEIEQNFPKISQALLNCKDFVVSKARFLDDRILRSYNTLIPFVYFFYLQPNQQVKSEETLQHMNYALYLSLMTATFSRFADNYIDHTVNHIIFPSHKKNPGKFPLGQFLAFIQSKQGRGKLDDWLLQNNIGYLMNILGNGTHLPEGRRSRRPEVDHIFPSSKLQARGVPEEKINNYANFRLISQPENNWKRAQDPRPYFKANPKAAAPYYIPTNLLAYEQFDEFLKKRRELIWKHLTKFFGSIEQPALEEIDEAHSDVELVKSSQLSNLRQMLEQVLTSEQKSLPVVKDATQWVDIYRKIPFTPQWSGRHHSALKKSGIQNVGDFALAVIALKIKVTYVNYNLPVYNFVSSLPDGSRILIPTRDFGGYAWKYALETLKKKGLDWTKYVEN